MLKDQVGVTPPPSLEEAQRWNGSQGLVRWFSPDPGYRICQGEIMRLGKARIPYDEKEPLVDRSVGLTTESQAQAG